MRTLLLTVTDGYAADDVSTVVEKIQALGSDIELYAVGLHDSIHRSTDGCAKKNCCKDSMPLD
ncbi:MAG: hypothetical protein GY737_20335 [Desulfobacteraceae bacterium]|nr:hypothetical protein [Desulfobacteraceae bacterium]